MYPLPVPDWGVKTPSASVITALLFPFSPNLLHKTNLQHSFEVWTVFVCLLRCLAWICDIPILKWMLYRWDIKETNCTWCNQYQPWRYLFKICSVSDSFATVYGIVHCMVWLMHLNSVNIDATLVQYLGQVFLHGYTDVTGFANRSLEVQMC